jgi:hypothetical protein
VRIMNKSFNINRCIIRHGRTFSIALLFVIVFQFCLPQNVYGLTSGPSQPEFNTFTPVQYSDLVDPFTGDFSYNIPLFQLPGPNGSYPFNLAYNAGITMDQEASWVGLGWNLNVGAITRNVRGLPDDFNGALISNRTHMLPNTTWDLGVAADIELVSKEKSENGVNGPVLKAGLNFIHNSYTGFNLGLNTGINVCELGSSPFSIGTYLRTNAIEGASLTPTLGLTARQCHTDLQFSLAPNFTTREGLTSLSFSAMMTGRVYHNVGGPSKFGKFSHHGQVSFEKASFIPSFSHEYRGGTQIGELELGWETPAFIHLGGSIRARVSEQRLLNNDPESTPVRVAGYGYLYQKPRHANQNFLLDIVRTGQGPIHDFTENLAVPISTPDVFNVSCQGLQGTFQAQRTDVGIYSDPSVKSLYGDESVGIDINPGSFVDIGVNVGGSVATSDNRVWDITAKTLSGFQFQESPVNKISEPVYFKMSGDRSAKSISHDDYLAGNNVIRVGLGVAQGKMDVEDNSVLEDGNVLPNSVPVANSPVEVPRVYRSTNIQYLTNDELLLNEANEDLYGLFSIEGINRDYPDDDPRKDHIAGFEIVGADGNRYVFALPVYNIEHREYLFTVPAQADCDPLMEGNDYVANGNINFLLPGTEQFFQMKELPDYVHSYLLTSIVGPDYVDSDDTPGPSIGDLGYWVKFDYEQTENYTWRTPYEGASYIPGSHIIDDDDKGSFLYGVREQYYLIKASTRTHRAEFELSNRDDARGVSNELVGGEPGTRCKKLDEIRLYANLVPADNPIPLKRIKFNYGDILAQDLCAGAPNAITGGDPNAGKLTLFGISMSYENSKRGESIPYAFTYYSEANYDYKNQNRWGQFEDHSEGIDFCIFQEFPQVSQYELDKEARDANAAMWSLKTIKLPSGSTLSIDYESDEYSFVQDRPVMDMFKITGIIEQGNDIIPVTSQELKLYFRPSTDIDDFTSVVAYFKDLHGLILNADGTIQESEQSQLFYKINIDIRRNGLFDFVTGYARIRSFGFDISGVSGKKIPYVIIEPYKIENISQPFPAFSAAAWHKLKIEYPYLIIDGEFDNNDDKILKVVKRFIQSIADVRFIFEKFFTTCSIRGFGIELDLENSYLRLNSPNSLKFGGNGRVRQITFDDQVEEEDPTYGQVFAYEIGVATNEPSIGQEDSPLRYAEIFGEQLPIHSPKNLMFEYPANDMLMPGASIGYSKIIVKDLATHLASPGQGVLDNITTTGRTEYEFYTAKDFPVIFSQTPLEHHRQETSRWLGLLGNVNSVKNYTGSQGYAIELNDMHGKPKRTSHFASKSNGDDSNILIHQITYEYFEGPLRGISELGKPREARTIRNDVEVISGYSVGQESNSPLSKEIRELGVERELVLDMREAETESKDYTVTANLIFSPLLLAPFPLPLPGSVPQFAYSRERTRTVVTNKIIRRYGILKQMDVYNGQSHAVTSYDVFDPYTGEPVLQRVNNAFDQSVYAFNLPAHLVYPGMGSASQNSRFLFTGTLNDVIDECGGEKELSLTNSELIQYLNPGDEYIAFSFDQQTQEYMPVGHLFAEHITSNGKVRLSGDLLAPSGYHFLVVRSGRKNQLISNALTLAALESPFLATQDPGDASVPSPDGNISLQPFISKANSIIQIQATTYRDYWSRDLLTCTEPIIPEPLIEGDCQSIRVSLEDCHDACSYTISITYDDLADTSGLLGHQVHLDATDYYGPGVKTLTILSGEIELLDYAITTSGLCTSPDCDISVNVVACAGYQIAQPAMLPFSADANFVRDGVKSFWGPDATYAYVADRNLANFDPADDVSLNADGIMDEVPLFDFKNPFFRYDVDGSRWIQSNWNARLGPTGNAVESSNAIGTYQATLTSYTDPNTNKNLANLPVATAENARLHEIAFEGFEEPVWILPPMVASPDKTGGNLILSSHSQPELVRTETYKIIGAISTDLSKIVVNKEYSVEDNPDHFVLYLYDVEGNQQIVFADFISAMLKPIGPYNDPLLISNISNLTEWTINVGNCLDIGNIATGIVDAVYCSTEVPIPIGITPEFAKAHTGKQSLYPQRNALNKQYLLNLQNGKNYIVSAWIHNSARIDDGTFEIPNFPYFYLNQNTFEYPSKAVSPIIEGWQKYEIEFTADEQLIVLDFRGALEHPYYIDDIRIHPRDAVMQTYVYDPINLKLVASHDANNYTTFYFYDDEGKLTLIKKETDKGILTVKESKSNIQLQTP